MAGMITGTNIREDLQEALCDGETQGGELAYDYLLDWLEAIVHSYQERAFEKGRKAGLGEAVEAVKAMEVDTDNDFVNTVQVGMKRAILMRLREALAGGGGMMEPEQINYISVGFASAFIVDEYVCVGITKGEIKQLNADERFIRVGSYLINTDNVDELSIGKGDTEYTTVRFRDGSATIITSRQANQVKNYMDERIPK